MAIRHSGNSAPGPDGIPFKAWRALGPLGVSILFEVAKCLETDDAQEYLTKAYNGTDASKDHRFNHSILVCLPKKKALLPPPMEQRHILSTTHALSVS